MVTDRGSPPPDRSRSASPPPRWPYCLFFALGLAFCAPYLRPGRALLPVGPGSFPPWNTTALAQTGLANPLMLDALVLTYPARLYNAESLRGGEIPFWNPHIFCGYPHLAQIQNHTLYPLTLPFDLLEPVAGMAWAMALHLGLAGALMFAFLRALGLEWRAALAGGLAFELNGFFLVRLSAPSYVFSGAWLPLMLLGVTRLAQSGRLRKGWPLVLATAFSVLGGHPQITGLSLVLAVAFLAGQAFLVGDSGAPWRLRARALVQFAALVVLGVALAGYQVVPFLELVGESARRAVPLNAYRRAALPALGLVQAVLPDAFGHPVTGNYWFDTWAPLLDGVAREARPWSFNASGENLYTGLPTLFLAGLALFRGSRRRDTVFFAAVALVSLAVLLGTPALDLAYRLIPGFATSRPDRVTFVWMAAVSVLAAIGVDASLAHDQRREAGRGRLVLGLLAGALALWLVAPYAVSEERRAGLGQWLAAASREVRSAGLGSGGPLALGLLAGSALLARRDLLRSRPGWLLWGALLVAPNAAFGWKFNPAQSADGLGTTALEREMLAAQDGQRLARILSRTPHYLPSNLPQILGQDDVQGASAAALTRYVELMTAADPGAVALQKYFFSFHSAQVAQGPLLDLLSVGWVFSDLPLGLPEAAPEAAAEVRAYRNPTALPRFRLVHQVETAASSRAAIDRLLSPDFDPASRALVTGPLPAALAAVADAGGLALDEVRIVTRQAHRIELEVRASRPGLLVTSEVFYPGWETLVDGQRVETLLVNGAFRGAVAPAGAHRVTLRFVPHSFYLGLALTVASLGAFAFLVRPGAR